MFGADSGLAVVLDLEGAAGDAFLLPAGVLVYALWLFDGSFPALLMRLALGLPLDPLLSLGLLLEDALLLPPGGNNQPRGGLANTQLLGRRGKRPFLLNDHHNQFSPYLRMEALLTSKEYLL